jgi:murein DD-endopeptidase MepM/ murein hydrolase activator NlpD
MARRVRRERSLPGAAAVVLAIAALAVLVGVVAVLARPQAGSVGNSAATPLGSAAVVADLITPSPQGTVVPARSPRPSAKPTAKPPAATPRPTGTVVGVRRPTAPPAPSDFDVTGQVIDIVFPLRPDVAYRYRDNWLERRAGTADPYNHARETEDGRLLRLHDGIDIYGPEGAPVVAPFAGRVIDPASRWTPWEPDRYGLTVVIESTEPGSRGYTAMLVHLDHVWVDIGQRVLRGQVLGVLGRTGNAEDVRPQLHFELRAPFEIDWSPIGYERRVDAFNPYPSLVEADPKS